MFKAAFSRVLISFFLLGTTTGFAATYLPQDANKAVILSYLRVGEDAMPETSLSTEQFLEHIKTIEQGEYTVLPLGDILDALNGNTPLPPRALAITFDGAYRSNFENAFPVLLEKHIPFTVFYSSNALDKKQSDAPSWSELKNLSANKEVTVGVLPASYDHIAHKSKQDMTADLNKARQRFRETFNREADYLAYPYGEYSTALKDLAKSQGFKAAFGLQAGAVYAGSDLYSLPRFTMTERYSDLERFAMVANALPLPVKDLAPADPYIKDAEWYTGFTLPEALTSEADKLSCFLSGLAEPEIQKIGSRIEIRSSVATNDQNRIRLNCTLPGPNAEDDTPQWRWFGMLYHRDNSDVGENTETEGAPANTPQPDELPAPQE